MALCSNFDFNSTTCTQVDITFDFSKVLTYTDESGAIDLTGFVLAGDIKDLVGGSSLLTLAIIGDTQTTGFYIPDPTNGIIYFQIKKEDVLTAGVYPYEFILTNPSNDDSIFMQGTIQFFDRGF
tara:strand:+ start:335 stop:706 length:372 start_codon:yes stop_codon:yes gene_type:complete